jgi:hypothetical protein
MLETPIEFLANPPVNRRFKVGDQVRLLVPRVVRRFGYRLTPVDFTREANDLCRQPEAVKAWGVLAPILGLPVGYGIPHDFRYFLRGALCEKARFGGPTRGIHVQPYPIPNGPGTILRAFRGQIGERYPGGGSGEDYEPGGLAGRRTVVGYIVSWGPGGGCAQHLSGDLVAWQDAD